MPSVSSNKTKPKRSSTAKALARLDFRIAPENKQVIEKAATLNGQSVSDFAVSTLLKSAREVLEHHGQTTLSNRDRDIFLEMLDNPPQPNEALRRAVKDYRQLVKK
jgi:uncharacterized protein (DUF1778 family)